MRLLCIVVLLVAPYYCSAQWSVIHASGNNGGHRDLFFLNNDTGYVIGTNPEGTYILRTRNGGTDWDSLWYGMHDAWSVFFTSADTGYIGCFYENTVSVMRTVDAGDSWQRIADGLVVAASIPYAISFFDNNTGIITLPTWAAKTTDAGITWTVLENYPGGGTRDGDIVGDTFIGLSGSRLVWTLDSGATFSADTLDYQGSHYFLEVRDHRFVASAIGSGGIPLGFPNGSFGIITRGDVLTEHWEISYFPYLSRVFDLSWPSENIIYAVHNWYYTEPPDEIKFFMKSVDGGQTWYRQEHIGPYYYGTQDIFCPSDTVCYAVGGNNAYIYKTTNGGGPLLEQVEQIVLSVKAIEDDLDFTLSPNPTSGICTVTSQKEIISEVKVFDLQGKAILQANPNDFIFGLNLEKLNAGIYLVQVTAGNKLRTGKVVLEK